MLQTQNHFYPLKILYTVFKLNIMRLPFFFSKTSYNAQLCD